MTTRRTPNSRAEAYLSARPRVFGALRGAVKVGAAFFEPLPTAELIGWSSRVPQPHALIKRNELASALKAFWTLTGTSRLSPAEQCALLAVSRRTLGRWRVKPSIADAAVLDRLRLIFLTHECLKACFAPIHGPDSSVVMWYVHLPGTAHNPHAPNESVLEALSERSVLAMLCRYGQMHTRFMPTSTEVQSPLLRARGDASRGKRQSRASHRSRPNPR